MLRKANRAAARFTFGVEWRRRHSQQGCADPLRSAIVQDFCQIARAAGVELQPVFYDGAASDASAACAVDRAQWIYCIGYVRESSHGYEVMPLSAFDNLLLALVAFVKGWEG